MTPEDEQILADRAAIEDELEEQASRGERVLARIVTVAVVAVVGGMVLAAVFQ
jgi:hypothetical protein